MEINRQQVERDPLTGSEEVTTIREHVASPVAKDAAETAKAMDWVWYVVGIIEVLLLLRIAFLLLGAASTGFAALIYALTSPLVSPFRGIFASPGLDTGYFDSGAVLAMLIYALLGWGVSSMLALARRRS